MPSLVSPLTFLILRRIGQRQNYSSSLRGYKVRDVQKDGRIQSYRGFQTCCEEGIARKWSLQRAC